jgi:2'-5' RNA ligase
MHYVYRQEQDDQPVSSRYALVIYLPEDLDNLIAPLREKYDPDYNVISSHVTLVAPFESDKSLGEISGIVRSETEAIDGLKLKLKSIGDYYPMSPIIFWKVEPDETLVRFCHNLYGKLDLPLPFKQFSPHVTVAKEISNHRVFIVKGNIVDYLPDESLSVAAVDLVSPVADKQWLSVRTFSLSPGIE